MTRLRHLSTSNRTAGAPTIDWAVAASRDAGSEGGWVEGRLPQIERGESRGEQRNRMNALGGDPGP